MGPLTVVALARVRRAPGQDRSTSDGGNISAMPGSRCRSSALAWVVLSGHSGLAAGERDHDAARPCGAARQRRLDHGEPALLQAPARSRRQRRGRHLGALSAADPDRRSCGLVQGRARRHRHARRGRDADGARHHPDRAAALCVPGRHRADRAAHRQCAARARPGVRVRAAAGRRAAQLFDADPDRHPGLFGRGHREQRGACPAARQQAGGSNRRVSAPVAAAAAAAAAR